MEAFTLGFWFVAVGIILFAIAWLWLVSSKPESGGPRPKPTL